MSIKDGGPAFPRPMSEYRDNGDVERAQSGMTLRDYFAAQAMAEVAGRFGRLPETMDKLAKDCYAIADAMLAAREAKQ